MSNKACIALAGFAALAGVTTVATVLYRKNLSTSDQLPARVVVTEHPDDGGYPYFRHYDVNAFVTDQTIVSSDYLRDGVLRRIAYNDPEPEETTQLMVALMAINGVKSVTFYPYQVVVNIGAAFDWDYIEPQVLDVFREAFGWGNSRIDISREEKRYANRRM